MQYQRATSAQLETSYLDYLNINDPHLLCSSHNMLCKCKIYFFQSYIHTSICPIQALASELLHQVQDCRLMLRQQLLRLAGKDGRGDITTTDSMTSRAQSIASDILDMSASDLAEFLKDEADEEKIKRVWSHKFCLYFRCPVTKTTEL